ncbi:MAG TPA: hypothetical protein VJR89_19665 [Polyangiales bacterium]|nr:hypothetical protein [Polyangiales bacterium]
MRYVQRDTAGLACSAFAGVDIRSARYWAAVLALLTFAIAIRFEVIQSGFFADDYAQLGMLEHMYPVARSKLNLFTFSDGSRAEGDRLIRSSFYPWFTDPTLRLSMLRPLASALIALDHRWFGRDPLGYHIHALAWWCGLFAALAALYRQLLPPALALLSLALFATDEGQVVVTAWIANRSASASLLSAVLGLALYVSESKRRPLAIALCFTLAFGFGEYALCVLGYVLAYEWTSGSPGLRTRLSRGWPVAMPTLVYLAVRGALHFAPQSSGVYLDPFADPALFARAALHRVPVMAADLLLSLRGEYWTFGHEPWFARWIPLPGADDFTRLELWRALHLRLGIAALGVLALCIWFVWRRAEQAALRWLSLGSALSVLPVLGSFPSSRLLLCALIGFCPLVAALFLLGMTHARALLRERRKLRALALGAAVSALCAYQLLFSIWLTRDWVSGIDRGTRRTRRIVLELEADDKLPFQHVIVLAAPDGSTTMYAPLTRWVYGRSVPRSCFTVSFVPAAYRLERIAEHAFTIEYDAPAAVLRMAHEQLLHGPQHPFQLYDVIDTGVFRVLIQSLRDGLPNKLLFRFEWPLEHPAYRFLTVTERGMRVFKLPPVGASVVVPKPVMPDD